MRTVHVLTRRLKAGQDPFRMSVRTGSLCREREIPKGAMAGFLIGAGPGLDYRAAALVHHSTGPGGGIIAAVDSSGRAVFRDMTARDRPLLAAGREAEIAGREYPGGLPDDMEIRLMGRPEGEEYALILEAVESGTGAVLSSAVLKNTALSELTGNVALLSHPGVEKDGGRFWFKELRLSGGKFLIDESRTCGPVLCTMYTLSRSVLKMTAQMMPIGESDNRTALLEIEQDGEWREIAKSEIKVPGFTANFRVEDWDSAADVPYRVSWKQKNGSIRTFVRQGVIRHDPVEKREIVVAAFTGNHNVRKPGVDRGIFDWTEGGVWFPHSDICRSAARHDPDLLFFSGDQVYEGASPTRAEKKDRICLDYLYKWYLWCWAFGDLTGEIPTVCIPDDHDVFQGNIWGAGGRKARRQDDGGYTNPASFVRMVERTQTGHLPDPFDPAPVEQGIGVYYCSLNLGGIGFAVLEDRKFKSSATDLIPEGRVGNGWFGNPDFDPAADGDVPGAVLLGERQLAFLREWAADWSGGVCMKAALSQTIFSNVATLPETAESDAVVPGLKRLPPGGYAANDRPVADADSNGWPQSGRNRALRELRRAFAVHIAGDQHLGSTIQYGVDDWGDAGFAICVPSIANFFPRRWYPSVPARKPLPGAQRYAGDFLDGFGNRMTVLAVSNPVISGREPAALHDGAPGFGIVRFDKDERTITFACRPRSSDPADPGNNDPYPGWPITVRQRDNYGRRPQGFLPEIRVTGMTDPVVGVIDETRDETVYTLRIRGRSFRPMVFREGRYRVIVGEPGTPRVEVVENLVSRPESEAGVIEISF